MITMERMETRQIKSDVPVIPDETVGGPTPVNPTSIGANVRANEPAKPHGRGRGRRSEMIGRVGRGGRYLIPTASASIDWTRTDWAFWDRLRRGKEQDYDLGGLFASPIAKILAFWGFGDAFSADIDHRETSDYIANWINQHLPELLATLYDSFSLGDAYLMVNPDGSTVRFSPDQVQILCNPPSSQNVIGYKVTTRLEGVTQIDYFYADIRITELHGVGAREFQDLPGDTPKDSVGMTPADVFARSTLSGRDYNPFWTNTTGRVQLFAFPNLSGKIPVIHFANEPGANEVYGHPYIEALLKDFFRYNVTINKALDGVEVMGNPIPVIEGVDDPDGTLQRLATSTTEYTDQNGDAQTRYEIDFAQIPVIVVGTGGVFKLAAPQQFTADAGRMLELLFLLMLQFCGIPEWVWGGAIASSKASVDAQFPAFEKLIGGIRQGQKHNLYKLIDLVISWRLIYDRTLQPLDETCTLDFQPISPENREALVKELTLARAETSITRKTMLQQLKWVKDPESEVEDAQAEAKADAPDLAADTMYTQQAGQADPTGQQDPPPDNGGTS